MFSPQRCIVRAVMSNMFSRNATITFKSRWVDWTFKAVAFSLLLDDCMFLPNESLYAYAWAYQHYFLQGILVFWNKIILVVLSKFWVRRCFPLAFEIIWPFLYVFFSTHAAFNDISGIFSLHPFFHRLSQSHCFLLTFRRIDDSSF